MTTAALQFVSDTSPDVNASHQPATQLARDVGATAIDFRSRIQRTLVADRYERKVTDTASISDLDGTRSIESRSRAIVDQINHAVGAAFPQALPSEAISLQALQEWEGYVTAIVTGKEIFTACLVDVTAGQGIEEEVADFPIADLSDDDRKLLAPGAVFRWVIGYQRSRGGTKRRVSHISFRRMPAWSRRDIAEAKERAATLLREIPWD
jgi:hypothetical protein